MGPTWIHNYHKKNYDLLIQYSNQAIMLSQKPCENPPKTKKIKQCSNFREEEDICLIEIWINTSMDALWENEQKKRSYCSTSFHVRLILENYKEQNRNGM